MTSHPSAHRPRQGMVTSSPATDWSADLTGYLERQAERLAARGVPHPDAAAAALAARGRLGLDRDAFARRLRLPATTVAAAEAGRLPLDRFPPPLARRVRALDGRRGAADASGDPGRPGADPPHLGV
ncbi:MAG: hypothetical protein U0Q07_13350 [Acidimicrobiales bacterium]